LESEPKVDGLRPQREIPAYRRSQIHLTLPKRMPAHPGVILLASMFHPHRLKTIGWLSRPEDEAAASAQF